MRIQEFIVQEIRKASCLFVSVFLLHNHSAGRTGDSKKASGSRPGCGGRGEGRRPGGTSGGRSRSGGDAGRDGFPSCAPPTYYFQ